MSAFLIALRHPSPGATGGSHAFDVAAARLRSRRDGVARIGSQGNVHWAVIAGDAEFSRTPERLTVVDTGPFMIEPPRGALAQGAAGTDLASPLTGAFAGVTVRFETGHAVLRRDEFGAKPLYYVPVADGWAVASEAKALTPLLSAFSVNDVALSDAVNYRWVLGEDFLVDPIRQVLPGAEVHLRPGAAADRRPPHVLTFEPDTPSAKPFGWYRAQAEDALRASLRRVCANGAELAVLVSGGVDSSVIAALAKDEGLPVRGYIVRYDGFANPEYDRARAVARWLGIEVAEVVVPPGDAGERLPKMVWRLEQPPRHANNLALDRLFAAIRARSDVVAHGDGAEMMFGLQDSQRVRQFARKRIPAALLFGWRDWRGLRRWLGRLPGDAGERVMRLLEVTVPDFARRLDEIPYGPSARALLDELWGGRTPCPELSGLLPRDRSPSHEELQTYQTYTFLQCSLARLDRLASPVGISVALPFLSQDVLEVARRLPSRFKYRDGEGRPILREICSRYLPEEVAHWPKIGFQTPDRDWVMGPGTVWRSRLFDAGDGRIARFIPTARYRDLLDIDDHEARWLLITLELALRQLEDRNSIEPFTAQM